MGFTSAIASLAHGILNWDTQLKSDMTNLVTYLQDGVWTPQLGGSGAAVGSGGTVIGKWNLTGNEATCHGQITFGTGASFGAGQAGIQNLPFTYQGLLASGTGFFYKASDGSSTPVYYTPSGGGVFIIRTPTGYGFSLGTPAAGDQLFFNLQGTKQ